MQYSIEKVENGYVVRIKRNGEYQTFVYSDFKKLVNSIAYYFNEISINKSFDLEKC